VEVYDPDTDTWQFAHELSQPKHAACASTVKDTIVVVGGGSGSSISETMVQWRLDGKVCDVTDGSLVARRGAMAVVFEL
jgi:translation initiation factor 1 (eIF-1/SUI1)